MSFPNVAIAQLFPEYDQYIFFAFTHRHLKTRYADDEPLAIVATTLEIRKLNRTLNLKL